MLFAYPSDFNGGHIDWRLAINQTIILTDNSLLFESFTLDSSTLASLAGW